MKDLKVKAVAKVSQESVFSALAIAALKVRANRISANQIIRAGGFELIVADDENGDGLVVQMILPMEQMEAIAIARASEIDEAAIAWNEHEWREWLAGFWAELGRYLLKWQDVRVRRGPGENVTIEKAVSR
jgi:hypothetical protein